MVEKKRREVGISGENCLHGIMVGMISSHVMGLHSAIS